MPAAFFVFGVRFSLERKNSHSREKERDYV
jgi:hypothetical protein